ncbi:acyl carrier protein [Amycolatopsis sp. A1MSW2902]|uniref:acyl carrier protein n=1 Tax=unclassified Amycolatopsis TaxID=2618356 RepID=UPI00106DF886|nr:MULTISPECIES: phosphopantetheine-binding protein [unclassified Amycolatopsis]
MTETTQTTQTLTEDRVVEGITGALGAVLERDVADLSEDTRLSDAGLDSTGVLELLMQLEDTFGIEFDTENLEMQHFESVRSLAAFVIAEIRA